ncbi:MAG: hypothetical protein HYT79_08395 [Elusimicrobia bacterium]|nr:hypothetical protein [Elusimicrobiota bacterium]
MNFVLRIFLLALLVLTRAPLGAEDFQGAWLRTKKLSTALNPDISLIGEFLGQTSGNKGSGFALREAELGIQSIIDPYSRADFFISTHDGEPVELEEGFITLLSLPLGLQARGGKFLANFGRLNMVHSHEQSQADVPVVLQEFLGEEGLNSAGVELSRIVAPFGIFGEITYAFLNDLGGAHAHDKEVTTTTVTNTDLIDVDVAVHKEDESAPTKLKNFAHVSRLRLYKDLSHSANLEVGFSGALYQPQGHAKNKTGGIDLTFRWRPLQEGMYRSFTWRTEGLFTDRDLEEERDPLDDTVVEAPARRINRKGVYSYVEYQPARRWRFGVRGDYLEEPHIRDKENRNIITRAVAPYITFTASEFNRIRLQYQAKKEALEKETEHLGFLQWVVVLGPHGAHPF